MINYWFTKSWYNLKLHILNGCPNVVALNEPLTPTDFDPLKGRAAAIDQIVDFIQPPRAEILSAGKVLARHKGGVVPENPVSCETNEAGLRKMDVTLGRIDVAHQVVNDRFTLIVKHNALFTALLPGLMIAVPMLAVVRNPLAVLASWNSVDLPVNKGRLPAGEMYSAELVCALAAGSDIIHQQLIILEWFCAKFIRYLPANIIRYEDFVDNPLVLIKAMSLNSQDPIAIPKRSSRNISYDFQLMELLYKRLLNYGDAIWSLYSREDLEGLMDAIQLAKTAR